MKSYQIGIFLLLFGGVAIGAFALTTMLAPNAQSSPPPAEAQTSPQPSAPSFTPITAQKEGIDITIENVRREQDTTTIDLYLNNHQFDLSTDNIFLEATLDDQPPLSHTIVSTAMGGHHTEAQITFEGELSETLTLPITEDIIFTFPSL